MGNSEKGAIAAVAEALEAEIAAFHAASAEARRIPLTSRKNLERAAKATEKAAEVQSRVLIRVQELVQALTAAREVEEAKSVELHEFAIEVKERGELIAGFLSSFAALGEKAHELNALLVPGGADGQSVDASQIGAACEKLTVIADDAKALAADAKEKQVEDVSREAESLRQEVLAARNKLKLLLS